jgi:hypothetical protein
MHEVQLQLGFRKISFETVLDRIPRAVLTLKIGFHWKENFRFHALLKLLHALTLQMLNFILKELLLNTFIALIYTPIQVIFITSPSSLKIECLSQISCRQSLWKIEHLPHQWGKRSEFCGVKLRKCNIVEATRFNNWRSQFFSKFTTSKIKML